MDLHLADKVAIVTGASRGIGRAIAATLAGEGARVVAVARTREQLEDLAAPLSDRYLVHAADLMRPETPGAVVAATLARFGRLDVLVNNAGATKRGDFLTLADADWADGFNLKFFGAMRLSRAAWPHLRASSGTIVNIVGIGGRTGMTEFAIGGAVNAALLNLTKVLADRGVTEGVRVNAVNPGAVATDRLQTRLRLFAPTTASPCRRPKPNWPVPSAWRVLARRRRLHTWWRFSRHHKPPSARGRLSTPTAGRRARCEDAGCVIDVSVGQQAGPVQEERDVAKRL
jgi:3-oxoacyl-[acyl-carrier protein] reductase